MQFSSVMKSADYLNIPAEQLLPSIDYFSSMMAWTYSKMTTPGFIRLTLLKRASGSIGHHFPTWIGHRPEPEHLWKSLGYTVVPFNTINT